MPSLKYPPNHLFTIYLVKADHKCSACGHMDSYVKIGRTDDKPEARILGMQVNCPIPISLMRAFKTTVNHEWQLHRHFKNQRIRGEWFEYHPEMLTINHPSFLPLM